VGFTLSARLQEPLCIDADTVLASLPFLSLRWEVLHAELTSAINIALLHELGLTSLPQNAANYVSESIQGAGSTASKEANKNVAKDSDASLSTRAQAAGDAIGDKVDEQTHSE
jgi:hypothetical protein